jgi:ABC-2 type transport system ATP-binding protein
MPEIITTNLTKVYYTFQKEEGLKGSIKSLFKKKKAAKTAVDNFDLTIDEGEFIGLIGPNGAGKTTLIKMLTGIIHPSSGSLSVHGYTPYELKDSFKKNYAVVMGQKSQLWWDLPACDTFLLNKEIYGIPEDEYRKNLSFFTELLNIKDLMNIQVRNLSLGERMKMELVSSLLHNPRILFLDEPTIGLDAVAQKQIRQFLKDINETHKVSIILTSHYMEDIRHLCKRTVVINHGKKIYDGSLDSLIDSYQFHRTISVSFETATDFKMDCNAQWLEKNPYKVVFKVNKSEAKSVLQTIMTNYDVNDINIEEEDIGSVVERIYTLGAGGAI